MLGKVKELTSRPTKRIVIQPPGGPPAPEPIIYDVGVTDADLTVAAAAKASGGDADVTGTPPTCTGVTAK